MNINKEKSKKETNSDLQNIQKVLRILKADALGEIGWHLCYYRIDYDNLSFVVS